MLNLQDYSGGSRMIVDNYYVNDGCTENAVRCKHVLLDKVDEYSERLLLFLS